MQVDVVLAGPSPVLPGTYNFVNNPARKMVCSEVYTAETYVQNPVSCKIIEILRTWFYLYKALLCYLMTVQVG